MNKIKTDKIMKGGIKMKVKDCMCENVTYINPNSTISDCAKLMCDKHIGCIPVCNNEQKVIGLVTDRDLILRCVACGKNTNTTPVSEIMTSNVCYCNQNEEIDNAQKIMSENQIRRLPIVDDNNKIIGIITLGDLCKYENIDTKDVGKTIENICKCNNKNAE